MKDKLNVYTIQKKINKSWEAIFKKEFQKKYFSELNLFLETENKLYTIYPKIRDTFLVFNLCSFEKTKVVILGQDPYHRLNQAHGLAFSVPKGIKPPPSLKNIFKELNADLNFVIPNHGDLTPWAKQGVLLLNSTLTVREKEAASHQKKGWEQFTDEIIKEISKKKEGIIFLLWGKFAQKKEVLIDTTKHHILTSPHPSPLSAHNGFFGCNHFSKTNYLLSQKNQDPINWQI